VAERFAAGQANAALPCSGALAGPEPPGPEALNSVIADLGFPWSAGPRCCCLQPVSSACLAGGYIGVSVEAGTVPEAGD
jgi:hypothetical protein